MRLRSLLIGCGVLLMAGAAQAGTITELDLPACDDMGCEGATLNLKVDDQGGGMYLVTYTLNVSAYSGSLSGYNQIGWKAIAGATDVELIAAEGGLGAWSDVMESTVAANSLCDQTNGSTSKWCIYGFAALNGGDMVFQYQVTGGTVLPVEDWALSAQYADGPGEAQGHLISAHAPAIPEPSAALLFGVGIALVVRRTRR